MILSLLTRVILITDEAAAFTRVMRHADELYRVICTTPAHLLCRSLICYTSLRELRFRAGDFETVMMLPLFALSITMILLALRCQRFLDGGFFAPEHFAKHY